MTTTREQLKEVSSEVNNMLAEEPTMSEREMDEFAKKLAMLIVDAAEELATTPEYLEFLSSMRRMALNMFFQKLTERVVKFLEKSPGYLDPAAQSVWKIIELGRFFTTWVYSSLHPHPLKAAKLLLA